MQDAWNSAFSLCESVPTQSKSQSWMNAGQTNGQTVSKTDARESAKSTPSARFQSQLSKYRKGSHDLAEQAINQLISATAYTRLINYAISSCRDNVGWAEFSLGDNHGWGPHLRLLIY
jgi:predicted Zn-dependent protease